MRQDSMCGNSCLSEVVILFLHRELFLIFFTSGIKIDLRVLIGII